MVEGQEQGGHHTTPETQGVLKLTSVCLSEGELKHWLAIPHSILHRDTEAIIRLTMYRPRVS